MSEETHDQEKSSAGRTFSVIGATVIALLLLYILSTGPAFALLTHGAIEIETVATIYRPLDVMTQKVPIARKLLRWYVKDVWRADL